MKMIKFRAYDKVKKQVAQVMKLDLQGAYSEPRNVFLNNGGNTRHQGDFELMQYTGLKDKNGVEIYEGDIVKFFDKTLIVSWWNNEAIYVLVKKLYDIDKIGFGKLNSSMSEIVIEVIGNIYENPELLEVA